MWTDNETNRDFLNFKLVADTAAEMVIQANGKPVSLGVSGRWGVGKSSMIKLIEESLRTHPDKKFVFINFNAWLYQGYDDAKAALMDIIATELLRQAEERKTGLDQAKELLRRVDWLRIAKFAGSGIALAHGMPLGVFGGVSDLIQRVTNKTLTDKDCTKAEDIGKTLLAILKDGPQYSPPKKIQDLRDQFEKTLNELGITLVVFIDDLDRCLPDTTIATLEAIRLFLFLDNTAFIIAADDEMIRNAVRIHFGGIDTEVTDEIVRNYFDKLIQIPIQVPPLGTQEVRAYMMMLFIDKSNIDIAQKDEIRLAICKQLSEAWQGKRVDLSFIAPFIASDKTGLSRQMDIADRLAPFMVSRQIAGNPRLIKRFLNTLSLRIAIARNQGVSVDESILAKILLLERCGEKDVYASLISEIGNSTDGKPISLKKYEDQASSGEITELPSRWEKEFASDWFSLPPTLADKDLRAAIHVSRESIPLINPTDKLSTSGAELLTALRSMKEFSSAIRDQLAELNKGELHYIVNCLFSDAKSITQWAAPPILSALMTVAKADNDQAKRVSEFLSELDVTHLKTAIVPAISENSWAHDVFNAWKTNKKLPTPVSNAIDHLDKGMR